MSTYFAIDEALAYASAWLNTHGEAVERDGRKANAILLDCEGEPTMLHLEDDQAELQAVCVPFTSIRGGKLVVEAVSDGYIAVAGRRMRVFRETKRDAPPL